MFKNKSQSNRKGQSEERKQHEKPTRTQSKNKKTPQARENAGDQVAIGFSFKSEWLRKWHEFFGPITGRKHHEQPTRTRSKNKQTAQARENAGDQVAIGFSFESDWLREKRESSGPITERSETKPMRSWITFNAQLKIALMGQKSRLSG